MMYTGPNYVPIAHEDGRAYPLIPDHVTVMSLEEAKTIVRRDIVKLRDMGCRPVDRYVIVERKDVEVWSEERKGAQWGDD